MSVHDLICGATGSGKSEAELVQLKREALSGKTSIILADPHGTLAEEFLIHLAECHLLHRVIYDKLSETDLVPIYDWLTPSTEKDELQRESENYLRMHKFMQLLIRQGGLQTTQGRPIINKGLEDALKLYLYQDKPVPITWLRELYTPNSGVAAYMVAHCTDEDTRRQFERYSNFNAQTLNYHTGPADTRLRELLGTPSLRARTGEPSFDNDEFLEKKGILILSGKDCDPDAASVMMSAMTLKAYDFCRRKQTHPVLVVLEEAVNARLVGPQEVQMLAEVRKWGMRFRILVQAINFPDIELRKGILQNTEHTWFYQSDPESAALAAADVATRIVDPLKVHHTETRTRNADDGFEMIENTSHGKSKDKHGHTISKTSNTSHSVVRKTREVTEVINRYMSLSDQVTLAQQKLMKQQPGWRWYSGDLGPHYEPMEKHLWHHLSGILSGPLSEQAIARLKDAKLQKAIARVKESPVYRKPSLTPIPSNPEPPTQAKRKGAAARNEEGRGTK